MFWRFRGSGHGVWSYLPVICPVGSCSSGSFRVFGRISCWGVFPFVEDQAVKVVGEVGERQFGFGPGDADGTDEQSKAVLLMGEGNFRSEGR